MNIGRLFRRRAQAGMSGSGFSGGTTLSVVLTKPQSSQREVVVTTIAPSSSAKRRDLVTLVSLALLHSGHVLRGMAASCVSHVTYRLTDESDDPASNADVLN